jgi:oligopeptide transport system substrate-binding protein
MLALAIEGALAQTRPELYLADTIKHTRMTRLAIGLFLIAGLWGCGHPGNPSASGAILKRGLSGEPSSLDPAGASDIFSLQVVRDLYEGLTTESPTGSIIPGVAASWTVDPKGTAYTFHLRAGIRWSNGKPLRAQDFVSAWRRVVDPRQNSPVADDLRLILGANSIIAGKSAPDTLGVAAAGDAVLVVNLERPAAYFPEILAHPAAYPVYSPAAARAHGPDGWVSNGPYVLSRWQPGTTLEIAANPAYWDKANVHIPSVEYQFADENSQLARYRAGQIDVTDLVPANDLSALRAEHPGELVIAPYLATAYYGLNLTAKPLGSSVALRKALAMAIDRKRLVEAQGFGQVGAYGFVPPGTWNYDTESWPWAGLSDADRIAQAKQLYAQSGFSQASPLHLRLLYNSNVVIKRTAILIAAMWKETLGIDTELTEEEYRVFLQSRHDKSRWELARLGWNADFNDASNFLDVLRAQSANNDMGYANPAFDALLDQAAATIDVQQRRQLLQNAERLMLDDYPIIPLYYFVSKRLVKPYVLGVKPTPLDHVPSKVLTLAPH